MTDTQRDEARDADQSGTQKSVPDVHHHGHGHSVAAWVAVSVVMLGSLLMSIAVIAAVTWLFVVGAVVAVVGGLSGKVLSGMGFGAAGHGGH